MDLMQAVILGLVQGLGEFLPISSSAHLILAPWLFNWQDPGLAFDVALHFGTLVAIVLYFIKDWIAIVCAGLGRGDLIEHRLDRQYSGRVLWLLIAATIPGVLAGFFLEHHAESTFRAPLLIAATLSVVGFLLFLADRRLRPRKDLDAIGWKEALIIGTAQAFAIVPGVSRAGATITAALCLNIDRVSAARFSFLMSTPIIFGAVVLKTKAFFDAGPGCAEAVGVIAAAVSGYCAIAGLIKFVEKVSYKVFFWYRLALALVVACVWFMRHGA